MTNIMKIVATVPTVYGIETNSNSLPHKSYHKAVATVPTVYGIETKVSPPGQRSVSVCCNSTYRLRY